MMRAALFGRNPESQTERDQRYRADAAEPKRYEPQQALRQRTLILINWHQ